MRVWNGPARTPRTLARLAPKQSWYRVENRTAPEDKKTPRKRCADVYVYDEIGGWGVTASEFVAELQTLDVDEITLHINSPGGDVFDGVAIYNALIQNPAHIITVVDGLAASAASFIAQAGDEIEMSTGSMMMIHEASGFCYGNAGDMQEMADILGKVSDTIAGIYAERSGVPVEQWREAMAATTWYTAEEAVNAHLADRIATRTPDEDALAEARAWQRTLNTRRDPARAAGVTIGDQGPETVIPAIVEDPPPVEDQAADEPPEPVSEPAGEADPDSGEDAACTCTCEACVDGRCEDCTDQCDNCEASDCPCMNASQEPGSEEATDDTATDQAPAPADDAAGQPDTTLTDAWRDLVARLVETPPQTADDVLAEMRRRILL